LAVTNQYGAARKTVPTQPSPLGFMLSVGLFGAGTLWILLVAVVVLLLWSMQGGYADSDSDVYQPQSPIWSVIPWIAGVGVLPGGLTMLLAYAIWRAATRTAAPRAPSAQTTIGAAAEPGSPSPAADNDEEPPRRTVGGWILVACGGLLAGLPIVAAVNELAERMRSMAATPGIGYAPVDLATPVMLALIMAAPGAGLLWLAWRNRR